jgi:parvulin-like peptidyl-prolyl isomerase
LKGTPYLAKKQRKSEIKKTPTKRQLSKWQRQKKIQRIIIISGSVFIAIIIAFVGFGYYQQQVKPYHQPVLRVNDTVFDMKYYLKTLELYVEGLDETRASIMAQMVVGAIMQNALINQHAPELGITVDNDEVDKALEERNLPVIKPYQDAYRAELLTEKLLADYFDSKVPTTDEQVNIQAMVVPMESEAEEIIGKLNSGESFTTLAQENSIEDLTRQKGGDLGWIPKEYMSTVYPSLSDSSLEFIAFSIDPGTISKPVYDPSLIKDGGYWLLEVTEKDADVSCHVQGILVGSEDEANEIRSKLLTSEDFATLAESFSQDTQSNEYGGDLGWIQKGYGKEIIVDTAFSLDVGVISEPVFDDSVQTTGGYWIVKVLEKDAERQLSDDTRNSLKNEQFTVWLEGLRTSDVIEQYINEEQISWAVDQVYKNSGA